MIAINDHAPMLWKTTIPLPMRLMVFSNRNFQPFSLQGICSWLLESVHSIIPSISYVKFDFGLKIILLSGIFFAFYFYLKISFRPL